jgi:hypothetical protein
VAVSVVCGGGTRTRSMPSSARSILATFCAGKRRLGSLLPLRNLMPRTISCSFSSSLFTEKSLCLYVHTSSSLMSKGTSRTGLSSLILLFKSSTLVSACRAIWVDSPKLSWPSWSTRRYQIVLAGVSASFSACFPLADPLGAMMRVSSGGVSTR